MEPTPVICALALAALAYIEALEKNRDDASLTALSQMDEAADRYRKLSQSAQVRVRQDAANLVRVTPNVVRRPRAAL